MFPRRNWDSPTPSPVSECAPQSWQKGGGGQARLRVRGWGRPNSNDWRKSLALCLLCGLTLPVEGLLIRTTKTSRCCKLDSLFHSVLRLDPENWTRQSWAQTRLRRAVESVALSGKSFTATGRKTHFQIRKRMYILYIVVYSYSLQTEMGTSGRISIFRYSDRYRTKKKLSLCRYQANNIGACRVSKISFQTGCNE